MQGKIYWGCKWQNADFSQYAVTIERIFVDVDIICIKPVGDIVGIEMQACFQTGYTEIISGIKT